MAARLDSGALAEGGLPPPSHASANGRSALTLPTLVPDDFDPEAGFLNSTTPATPYLGALAQAYVQPEPEGPRFEFLQPPSFLLSAHMPVHKVCWGSTGQDHTRTVVVSIRCWIVICVLAESWLRNAKHAFFHHQLLHSSSSLPLPTCCCLDSESIHVFACLQIFTFPTDVPSEIALHNGAERVNRMALPQVPPPPLMPALIYTRVGDAPLPPPSPSSSASLHSDGDESEASKTSKTSKTSRAAARLTDAGAALEMSPDAGLALSNVLQGQGAAAQGEVYALTLVSNRQLGQQGAGSDSRSASQLLHASGTDPQVNPIRSGSGLDSLNAEGGISLVETADSGPEEVPVEAGTPRHEAEVDQLRRRLSVAVSGRGSPTPAPMLQTMRQLLAAQSGRGRWQSGQADDDISNPGLDVSGRCNATFRNV